MEIDLIRRYVKDAGETYQACLANLPLSDNKSDLGAILRAARRLEIDRRGTVTASGGKIYDYHIHGAGYTFKDLTNGKDIRFDVIEVDGTHYVRFSAWPVYKYAASVGESFSEETVAADLRRLSTKEQLMVPVRNGQTDTTIGLAGQTLWPALVRRVLWLGSVLRPRNKMRSTIRA